MKIDSSATRMTRDIWRNVLFLQFVNSLSDDVCWAAVMWRVASAWQQCCCCSCCFLLLFAFKIKIYKSEYMKIENMNSELRLEAACDPFSSLSCHLVVNWISNVYSLHVLRRSHNCLSCLWDIRVILSLRVNRPCIFFWIVCPHPDQRCPTRAALPVCCTRVRRSSQEHKWDRWLPNASRTSEAL